MMAVTYFAVSKLRKNLPNPFPPLRPRRPQRLMKAKNTRNPIMLAVVSTHGKVYREQRLWKIQCRFSDGQQGTVTGSRPSVLRKRLADRGVPADEIERLVPRDLSVKPKQ